ncbi:MAG: FAD-binding oxidoreductase, partial [Actinomycetota bacterium]
MPPQSPIELTGSASRLADDPRPLSDGLIESLRTAGEVITDEQDTANASRDWWPLALHWALQGAVPRRAAAVVCPTSAEGVAHVLQACAAEGVAVTAAGGRSGVVGGTVPLAGGLILDLTGLAGIESVDAESGLVVVHSGTFGPDLEQELRDEHGLTVGHYPQSFDL